MVEISLLSLSLTPPYSFRFLKGGGNDSGTKSNCCILMTALRYNKLDTVLGYIGEFEEIDDHRSGKIVVQLIGRINKTGVISPRFNIKLNEIEKWIARLLPSRQFGYVILTTSAGIMDHEEARRRHTGGKVLGYFY